MMNRAAPPLLRGARSVRDAAIHYFKSWIATASIKQKRRPRDDDGRRYE